MIHYQYLCFRVGQGDGFHWRVEPAHATHPYRLLIAHVEGEGEKRKATEQIEIQISLEQMRELAAQVKELMEQEDDFATIGLD